ncbi:hypothetical protein EGW08_005447 [Elysia chlorotica]|uniref:Chondroitin proteoglycan 4 domain-containing protein n=1 Tax=Elysia chlorotica TaxID=188477 RepID=A0A3S1BM38_ELYCH|nr:hypothetical protein EGW08_005447 [Elysia chlorotica]
MRSVRPLSAVVAVAAALVSCVQAVKRPSVSSLKDSDPLSTACKQICREKDRDMMRCAQSKGCAHFLDSDSFQVSQYQACMTPCYDVSLKCFSRCADNYNDMVIACINSGDISMGCLMDAFSGISTPAPAETWGTTEVAPPDRGTGITPALIKLLTQGPTLALSTDRPATTSST